MRLTTRGRYAVSALLYMALDESMELNTTNDDDNTNTNVDHTNRAAKKFSLTEISTSQNISLPYLEQIFNKLKRANIVTSFRGANGGYQLTDSASEINIAQIIDAVDESIDATHCGGKGDCNQGSMCLAHYLWEDLSDRIRQFLENITLMQLIESRQLSTTFNDTINPLADIEQMLEFKN